MGGSHQVDVLEGCPPSRGNRVHLWINDSEGAYQRLCDGIEWFDGLVSVNKETAHGVLACLECFWVFRMDQEANQPRLNVVARTLVYWGDALMEIPWLETDPRMASTATETIIPVKKIAEFYAADDDKKDSVVKKFKTNRDRSSEDRRGGDYYGPVLNLLKRDHWQHSNLEALENAISPFLQDERDKDTEKPKRYNRAVHYEQVLDAYVEFCIRERIASIFQAFGRTDVQVTDEVAVNVTPTIGMRIGASDHILIMLMDKCKPSPKYRQAVNFFLRRALTEHTAFLEHRTGLLDVRRKVVRHLLAMTSDEEHRILRHVELFHDRLEKV